MQKFPYYDSTAIAAVNATIDILGDKYINAHLQGIIRVQCTGWNEDVGKLIKGPISHWSPILSSNVTKWLQLPALDRTKLNNHISDGEGNIIGVVPYQFGMAIVDIDSTDATVLVAVIEQWGEPLAKNITPSGGWHFYYPVDRLANAEEATKAWPSNGFEINGIHVGEICCVCRYANIWDPNEFLKAYKKRIEVDCRQSISPASVKWIGSQKKASKDNKDYTGHDNGSPSLDAFIEAFDLTENKNGEWVGHCPECGPVGTATRFQVKDVGGSRLFNCHVCAPNGFENKQAAEILEKAMSWDVPSSISQSISLLGTKITDIESDTGVDEDITGKESVQVRIENIANKCSTRIGEKWVREIGSKTHGNSKPLKALITGCYDMATYITMPDDHAQFEVDNMIEAAKVVGVSDKECDEVLKEYQNDWRKNSSRVYPKHDDFPIVAEQLNGVLFDTKKEAEEAVVKLGGVVISNKFQFNAPDDWMTAIRATKVDTYWSQLDNSFTLQHDEIGEWVSPVMSMPPNHQPFSHLAKGINRSLCKVKKVEVEEINSQGEPVIRIYWSAESVLPKVKETIGPAIAKHLASQIGTQIRRVDETKSYTDQIFRVMLDKSPEERKHCVMMANEWLLHVDGVQVIDEDRYADLARAVSKIVYLTFMYRRLWNYPEHRKIFNGSHGFEQRYVPVFGGAQRVGKTRLVKCLLPNEGVFADVNRSNFGFAFTADDNDMLRKIVGRLIVNNDELKGMKKVDPNFAKEFITSPGAPFHRKFENYESFDRSDVFVGTTNNTGDIPSDPALQDRLVAIGLEPAIGFKDGDDGPKRYKAIGEWFDKNRETLMVGGLIMALDGEFIEPSHELDGLRKEMMLGLEKSSSNMTDSIEQLVRMGAKSNNRGDPFITLKLFALHAGHLKYTNDYWAIDKEGKDVLIHRANSLIRPSHTEEMKKQGFDTKDGSIYGPSCEWGDEVMYAFEQLKAKSNSRGIVTQMKDALTKMHGENGEDCIDRINEPKDVSDRFGRPRQKHEGVRIENGRLKTIWGKDD